MLTVKNDGAELVRGVLSPADLVDIETIFDAFPIKNAGLRIVLQPLAGFRFYAAVGSLVGHHLGANTHAVRAILFDKRKSNNWALGWHQDRTIAVSSRLAVAGFGPWTVKSGVHHVTPPIDLLKRMITVRVHLDAVDPDNAPLLVAPTSHERGLIVEQEIERVVAECGQQACLANAGDIWVYSTLILHASARAMRPRRRRVLQIDFSADNLPGGLEWAAPA